MYIMKRIIPFFGTLSQETERRIWFNFLQMSATVLAVGGVLLNNARIRWCFPMWFVSNVICLGYHVKARLWWLAVRDVIFTGLAIAGWFQWAS